MRTGAIVVLTLALAAPCGLAAQRRESSGFWYSVGLAPGWARVTCDICAGRRHTGISAFLGVGGSTGRGGSLRIGGELAGWREREGGVTQTLMSVGATAYWYPNLRRRFYLRGGAALVMHRTNDGADVITSSGIGPQLGIGYEYPVRRNWRLAPFAHYSVGVFGGDVRFNGGQAASSATVSFFQVGASLTRR
jgi:hypothetical protein